jgi:hypothetical protein
MLQQDAEEMSASLLPADEVDEGMDQLSDHDEDNCVLQTPLVGLSGFLCAFKVDLNHCFNSPQDDVAAGDDEVDDGVEQELPDHDEDSCVLQTLLLSLSGFLCASMVSSKSISTMLQMCFLQASQPQLQQTTKTHKCADLANSSSNRSFSKRFVLGVGVYISSDLRRLAQLRTQDPTMTRPRMIGLRGTSKMRA